MLRTTRAWLQCELSLLLCRFVVGLPFFKESMLKYSRLVYVAQTCACATSFGLWGQCSPVVRMLASKSGVPEFKIRSDHWLNLFLVVPGLTSQLHL